MSLAEFCGLDDAETKVIDLKTGLANEVKRRRTVARMTQATLAQRLDVAKTRIVEMESGRPGTSLDALVAAFFAVGGKGADLGVIGAVVDDLTGV